jgi:hypothetical protein
MARVATFLLASTLTPCIDVGMYNLNRTIALPIAAANNGDYLPIATVQRNGRIVSSKLDVSATLGAGCIVQLALYRAGALLQNLTGATTAGGASIVNGAVLSNADALAGDEIVLVVSGANIAAAATAKVDCHIQH